MVSRSATLAPCWASMLLAAIACGERAAPEARVAPHTTEAPQADDVPARCGTDDDCEIVDVPCKSRAAVHREVAPALRREWESEASTMSCRRPWAPPTTYYARCREGRCLLREVQWPELRGCSEATECVVLEDACGRSRGVRADRVAEARESLSDARARGLCARQREHGDLAGLLGDEEGHEVRPSPACEDGFCRP
jgi:hypothetical protein